MISARSLFDTHCHLTHKDFAIDRRSSLVHQAHEAGIEKLVVVATDALSLDGALDMQDQFGKDRIKIAAATPPHDITSEHDLLFDQVKKQAQKGRLSAFGETGLEYFYCPETAHFQKIALRRYLDCAVELNLPVAVHCREAFSDFISILTDYHSTGKRVRGMVHCFTGTLEDAKALIELGWYLSFSGIVTYPKAKFLQEVASWVPMDRILVETDSPYLAPKQKRGQENRPAYLVYIVEFLAQLRGVPYETFADDTFKNAESLFKSA